MISRSVRLFCLVVVLFKAHDVEGMVLEPAGKGRKRRPGMLRIQKVKGIKEVLDEYGTKVGYEITPDTLAAVDKPSAYGTQKGWRKLSAGTMKEAYVQDNDDTFIFFAPRNMLENLGPEVEKHFKILLAYESYQSGNVPFVVPQVYRKDDITYVTQNAHCNDIGAAKLLDGSKHNEDTYRAVGEFTTFMVKFARFDMRDVEFCTSTGNGIWFFDFGNVRPIKCDGTGHDEAIVLKKALEDAVNAMHFRNLDESKAQAFLEGLKKHAPDLTLENKDLGLFTSATASSDSEVTELH